MIDNFRRDLRDGLRALTGRPGFTAVAVLSLALGIGANTAIFSFVNAIILRDPGIDRPEQIVNLYMHQPAIEFADVCYPAYEDVRDGTTEVFSAIGASQHVPVQMDQDGSVVVVAAEAMTGSYLPMLGIDAVLGRTLLPTDDVSPGRHPVVMLDYRYWQSAFGGEEDVLSKELRLGGRSYAVIGVGPPDFRGSVPPLIPAFYVPYMMVEEILGSRMFDAGDAFMMPKARLKPGTTLPQAQAAVAAVATQLTEDRITGWQPDFQFELVPLTDVLFRPPVDVFLRPGAWLLMVVVGLVLLLACTNLASFLLARSLDRRKDIAVRLAFGASRASLVRRLLTETTLLSLLAGAVGIGSALWLLDLLGNVRTGGGLRSGHQGGRDLPPVTFDLSLDWNVLAFTLGISVVAGVLVGLVPALQSTHPDVATTLKSESAGGGQPGQLRWRNGLVITQVAVSLVLLVGAGLFLRSFQQMQSIDPGFGRQPTALMTFKVPTPRFTVDEARVYTRRLLDRLRRLPGVEAIGVIDTLHLSGGRPWPFNVDGHEPPADHDAFWAETVEVDAGFFDAAGIHIVRGRNFSDGDRSDSQRVVIISEVMAQRFWKDGAAVDRVFRIGSLEVTVVGVVSDTKVRTLDEAPRDMIYLPYSQWWTKVTPLTVVARTSADPVQTAQALIAAGREVDPDLWVLGATTMTRHLSQTLAAPAGTAFVLSAFAALAVALASIGLYGVVSYSVARRTREMGIRMALGADSRTVVRHLAAGGLKLVIVGEAIGLTIALLTTRLLSGLLGEIDTMDPMTFIVVPLVLLATGLEAVYLPARRAGRINPAAALRNE